MIICSRYFDVETFWGDFEMFDLIKTFDPLDSLVILVFLAIEAKRKGMVVDSYINLGLGQRSGHVTQNAGWEVREVVLVAGINYRYYVPFLQIEDAQTSVKLKFSGVLNTNF